VLRESAVPPSDSLGQRVTIVIASVAAVLFQRSTQTQSEGELSSDGQIHGLHRSFNTRISLADNFIPNHLIGFGFDKSTNTICPSEIVINNRSL